ncbi:MAG: SRPBCC family protein, partial [Chloroflexi bacterium]|nr:SRPBCC family protein [Chloroflexota bacterium]
MLKLIRCEFEVDAPLETAWQHLAQVERWPSWARHIRRVELKPPGDLTLQTSGTFHLSNGVRSTFKMVELNPPHHWKWVGQFLWITVHYDHIFEPINDQRTRLIWV